MEDSSFFRDQAELCRRQAVGADPMLQITSETLAIDCTAYADELDYPDDYWFANGAQTDTEPTWSAIQKILVGIIGNNNAWHVRAGGVDALERATPPLAKDGQLTKLLRGVIDQQRAFHELATPRRVVARAHFFAFSPPAPRQHNALSKQLGYRQDRCQLPRVGSASLSARRRRSVRKRNRQRSPLTQGGGGDSCKIVRA